MSADPIHVSYEAIGSDQIAEQIRAEIMDGRLRFGQKLSENTYAERLGVSRTPVREAILSLASLGLVTIRPRSGTYVATFTRDSLAELFQVRLFFEAGAVKLASQQQRYALAQRLSAMMPDLRQPVGGAADFARFSEVDTAFHRALVQSANNERLYTMYRPVEVCAQAARSRLNPTSAVSTTANDHHACIVQAIADDRIADFENALGDHLAWVLGMLIRVDELFESPGA